RTGLQQPQEKGVGGVAAARERLGRPPLPRDVLTERAGMCGIVGLLVKKEALRPRLGELMVPMLVGMTERGPDSSGMAVFTQPVSDGQRKLSLYCQAGDFDWKKLGAALAAQFEGVTFDVRVNHAVVRTTSAPAALRTYLVANFP